MKKITKFLVVALTVALLIGAVVGVSSSAADTESEKWVISYNVSYDENIHLFFAVDASLVADSSLLTANVYAADGTELAADIKTAEKNDDLYGVLKDEDPDNDGEAVAAYVVRTPGIAAKDMADELTVKVYYDGDEQESFTYSVAEYFYQRLYKDGVIEATEGKALSQKKLYEASIRYGAAAQKVLTNDTVLVDELVYIAGAGVDSIWNSAEYLTLDNGIYNVKSYVDDEIVESVVAGGTYIVDNSAIITAASFEMYGTPENAATVNVSETIDYGFATSVATKPLDVAGGAISAVHYRQNSASATLSVTAQNNEEGSDYISINKSTTGSGGQTWMNIVIDNTKTADLSTIVFEARMRLNISTIGSGYRIRTYTAKADGSSRTTTDGGQEVGGSGIVFSTANLGTIKKYSGSISGSTGLTSNTWFTMRIEISDYVEGENNYKVYILDEENNVFNLKYQAAESTITDASAINCICLMDSTTTTYTNDIEYLYVGGNPGNPSPAPDTTAFNATYKTVNGSSASWKGTLNTVKNILDNSDVVFVDDIKGDGRASSSTSAAYEEGGDEGQATYRFQKTAASGHSVSVSAEIMLDYSSEGKLLSTTGNYPELRLHTSGKKTNRIGWYYNNGEIYLYDVLGASSVGTGAALGEWFKVTYTYTYTPAVEEVIDEETQEVITPAVAASATVTIQITNASGETVTHNGKTSEIQDPASYSMYFSIIPTYGFIGTFGIRNVVFH